MGNIFSKIRESCAEVADGARWVKINHAKLMQYPEILELNLKILEHTSEHHLLGKGDDTLAFFLILDSINFGSGYFPYLKDKDLSGYYTVAKKLKEHCEKNGVPTAAELRRMTTAQCAAIFGQETTNLHMQELMELFALALNDLGEWVTDQYAGDYQGFLKQSKHAEEAVLALLKMPFFRDIARYGRNEVYFLKRAQILLQDLRLAEPNHSLLQFDDFNQLTIFADNVIPFVLKADGVLSYHSWLEERIHKEELIASRSYEEIEMRACSVHAVEILKAVISEELKEITVAQLDFCLWNRGQKLKKLTDAKRHRTRCVFY
jgi:hypothetical protein